VALTVEGPPLEDSGNRANALFLILSEGRMPSRCPAE
jgi:hypothetical protein